MKNKFIIPIFVGILLVVGIYGIFSLASIAVSDDQTSTSPIGGSSHTIISCPVYDNSGSGSSSSVSDETDQTTNNDIFIPSPPSDDSTNKNQNNINVNPNDNVINDQKPVQPDNNGKSNAQIIDVDMSDIRLNADASVRVLVENTGDVPFSNEKFVVFLERDYGILGGIQKYNFSQNFYTPIEPDSNYWLLKQFNLKINNPWYRELGCVD
jgi:hypothetical protein